MGETVEGAKNHVQMPAQIKLSRFGISVLTFLQPHTITVRLPMPRPPSSEVSQLLQAWNDGDETALEKLMPLVYKELHRMAHYYMAGESPGHTLQTTALVNEAYVRLVDAQHSNFQNRIHFFGRMRPGDEADSGGLGKVSPSLEARRKHSCVSPG